MSNNLPLPFFCQSDPFVLNLVIGLSDSRRIDQNQWYPSYTSMLSSMKSLVVPGSGSL
jgi:hypothetical protein